MKAAEGTGGRTFPVRALGLVAAVVLPGCFTLLSLRYLVPSRLEGLGGGALGSLSRFGEGHPLLLAATLFVVFSELARYWTRQWWGDAAAPQVRPGHGRAAARRVLVSLFVVAIVAFALRSSVAAVFRVVGPSMLPTLDVGDRMLVDRLAYGFRIPFTRKHLGAKPPRRGDLVVFPASGAIGSKSTQLVVKRVLGLPGDRVAFEQGVVLINDWPVPTCDAGPYAALLGPLTVKGRLTVEFLGGRTYLTVRKPVEPRFPAYLVKPGEVFVMGDDRGVSSDSRFWDEGRGAGVPVEMLEGRVARVLLGEGRGGRLDFSRLLAPPLDLHVRMSGIDLTKTDERIQSCLKARPVDTEPPGPGHARPAGGPRRLRPMITL